MQQIGQIQRFETQVLNKQGETLYEILGTFFPQLTQELTNLCLTPVASAIRQKDHTHLSG